jgi:uncharacterized protein YkwD
MRRILVALAATIAATALTPAGAGATERCLHQGAPVATGNQGTVERSLLCLTNVHRLRSGRGPLRLDRRLTAAARTHSAEMVACGYFGHVTPEGLDPSDLAAQAGYPGGVGENIAANGSGTALSLFQQWVASPGHNENMLTGDYRAAGMGVAFGIPGEAIGGGTGTQMFGSAPPDTGYTALDLYASSERCAKGKLARERLTRRIRRKKGRTAARRKLRQARALIRSSCRPPV